MKTDYQKYFRKMTEINKKVKIGYDYKCIESKEQSPTEERTCN